MTKDEVLALPVMIDLKTAAKALSMNRTMAYKLAANDQFPVALERFGQKYRLRRSDLLAYLGIQEPDP